MATPVDPDQLRDALIERVAHYVKASPDDVDPRLPFTQLGMDSLAAGLLASDLEKLVERSVDPVLFYQYPTIEDVVQFFAASS